MRHVAKWLELSGDFACNNRCIGCYSAVDDGSRMDAAEIVGHLRYGRLHGARWLWLGGGEPTLRRDLFPIVRAARAMGYSRVKLQTNGMLLAYPDYATQCVDAGITEVNFSIKGATAADHDRLTRTPGSFDHMMKGIENWRGRGLTADGDVLLYKSGIPKLVELIRFFYASGIERFNLWLFSATDQGDKDLATQVPKIADVVPAIAEAVMLRLSNRSDFITSLHTPPCTVPSALSACLFRSADLELIVANPGGYRFRLEESPIEGGHYLDRCSRCSSRSRCGGIREDYLAIYGDAEFQPEFLADDRPSPTLRDVVGLQYGADVPSGGDTPGRAGRCGSR